MDCIGEWELGTWPPSKGAFYRRNTRHGRIAIKLKDKVVWSEPPAKRIVRFPDPQSVGAQTTVASIATAYGLKGAWYAASAQEMLAMQCELHVNL